MVDNSALDAFMAPPVTVPVQMEVQPPVMMQMQTQDASSAFEAFAVSAEPAADASAFAEASDPFGAAVPPQVAAPIIPDDGMDYTEEERELIRQAEELR